MGRERTRQMEGRSWEIFMGQGPEIGVYHICLPPIGQNQLYMAGKVAPIAL